MSNTLFPLPDSPSPRLRWLHDHGLVVKQLANGRWICALDNDNLGEGADEEQACVDFCVKHQMSHWAQE